MKSPRYISSFSVIVSFVALALLGCALVPKLPVKLVPSENLPAISVSFSMTGASARTIESEVTSRLESALNMVGGIKNIQSKSNNGNGQIKLEFDRNTDLDIARFETAMIIRQQWSSMPENASYPQIAVRKVDDDSSRPFISYTINAGVQPAEIMAYADNNISPTLSRIPGVAKVELSGAMPMEWHIEYDNKIMTALGISVGEIRSALSSYYGSEYLRMAQERPDDDASWTRIAIACPEYGDDMEADLSKIVVATVDKQIITLDKIARVRHTEASPTGYYRIDGLNSIYLNVTADEQANQIELSKKIKTAVGEMSLPTGYSVILSYDASENIGKELDKIYLRTGLTVIILLLFVGLITLSLRYLMLITISLAINMAIAVVAYYFLGVEIQLYSLAGITISLNLVIDNLIVMTEHITRRHNLKAFTAVLAATLTTVGALSVVFFLDEETMLSLKDFVIVVIVNLTVSLLTTLFLVPALVERIRIRRKASARRRSRLLPVRLARLYEGSLQFVGRHRAFVFAAFILSFGLPVFLLPEKIERENTFAGLYNASIGSETYNKTIRPWVDRCLGGSLRLFAEKVNNGTYYDRTRQEPTLTVNATLPNGATLAQMNSLISRMERFIGSIDGIRQFQTSVFSPRRGSITVYFKPEYHSTDRPHQIKADIISKALTLGGGSWSVYGLEERGFSNDVREGAGSYRIRLHGYNYDNLYSLAESLRDSLLSYRRIKDVQIKSEFSYWKDDYTEFYLNVDKERLTQDSISVQALFNALSHDIGKNVSVTRRPSSNGSENIRLSSAEHDRDVWAFMNVPVRVGDRMVKLSDYAVIEQRQTPPAIAKKNQEYTLCLQYEYIGSNNQGTKLQNKVLEKFSATLPMGYKAEEETRSWNFGKDPIQYALLALIAAIIFFISAILFNSLRQPFAIIAVIPVSFIGVFLTFYIFDLRFDQGGFASFILLCGITVNAAIYIINEYNSLRFAHPHVKQENLYRRAFRAKITAVLLTVLSTVLGFIPFVIGSTREGFWFPLAAGTMGGLLMSMLAIFILLPLCIIRTDKPSSRKCHAI